MPNALAVPSRSAICECRMRTESECCSVRRQDPLLTFHNLQYIVYHDRREWCAGVMVVPWACLAVHRQKSVGAHFHVPNGRHRRLVCVLAYRTVWSYPPVTSIVSTSCCSFTSETSVMAATYPAPPGPVATVNEATKGNPILVREKVLVRRRSCHGARVRRECSPNQPWLGSTFNATTLSTRAGQPPPMHSQDHEAKVECTSSVATTRFVVKERTHRAICWI